MTPRRPTGCGTPCCTLAGVLAALVLAPSLLVSAPPSVWEPAGIGGGGALFVPSFSPHQANELYTASDMSDVFHSTDLGATWRVVDFREFQGGRLARVHFTSDPMILYSIDGANDLATPAKSTDGGMAWAWLSGDPTGGGAFSLFADPGRTDRLLVSDYNTIYFSSDGGASFTPKFSFPNGGNGCYVAGAFFDDTRIFVGTSAGLLVSADSGNSFTTSGAPTLPVGEEMVSFAGAKAGATVRFFSITAPQGSVYPGIAIEDLFGLSSPPRVYALDWGSPSWTAKTTGIDSSHRVVHVGSALDDVSTAWLAGGVYGQDWPCVYKTTNGGGLWQSALLTTSNQNVLTGWAGDGGDRGWGYGGGIVGFGVAPTDSSKAAFTDYGFLHLTNDGATTWRQAYVNRVDQNPAGSRITPGKPYRGNGLEDTSCWHLTWADASTIWACYTDIRGARSVDGGVSWAFDYSGHTENTAYRCLRHPVTGTLYLATSTVHDLYESTYLTDARIDGGGGRVLFSTDKGKTWQLLHNFAHPVVDIAFDPNNANTLYASVVHSTLGGIFVSTNINLGASSTWTPLPLPPRTQGHPFNIRCLDDGTLVCTYSGRRNTSGQFTDSSGVFVLPPGDPAWTDRSHANMHYWVKDLVLDPYDPTQDTWYVCVWSGWGGPYTTNNQAGGLYKTTNRGVGWTRIIGTTTTARVASCTVSPSNPKEMYVTTETDGLWYCENLQATSPVFTPVEGYPFRHPERVYFNPYDPSEVWVTGFGNGLRVGRIPAAITTGGWMIR